MESQIAQFEHNHHLRPATITILADYDAIGIRHVKIAADRTDYRIPGEPCAVAKPGELSAVGVGRIPLQGPAEASLLLNRGFLRDRRLASRPARALMVANPDIDQMDLPLCEAISRATAAELKNRSIAVDEFYRRPSSSPDVLAAATRASLIIYEGHFEHQELLNDTLYEYERDVVLADRRRKSRPASSKLNGPLEDFPVFMLQTCESLRYGILERLNAVGGVALLASGTPIHSASGAAFIKAVCDGVLYRGCTLGEAVRDAQNYFACPGGFQERSWPQAAGQESASGDGVSVVGRSRVASVPAGSARTPLQAPGREV